MISNFASERDGSRVNVCISAESDSWVDTVVSSVSVGTEGAETGRVIYRNAHPRRAAMRRSAISIFFIKRENKRND